MTQRDEANRGETTWFAIAGRRWRFEYDGHQLAMTLGVTKVEMDEATTLGFLTWIEGLEAR